MPGKDLDYKGPVLLNDICKQIVIDAEQQGYSISSDQAMKIVVSFFLHSKSAMKRGHVVIIDKYGKFGMSPKEKDDRLKRDYKEMVRVKYTQRKRARRRSFNEGLRKSWKNHCEKLVSKGLKPWTYTEWAKVFKKRRMRRINPLKISMIE